MKKILFALVALLGLSASAEAQVQMVEVAKSSCTSHQVNVTSHTATQMDDSDNVLSGRHVLIIQNQDATANMFCGFATGEITTSKGLKVAADASLTVKLTSHSSESPNQGTRMTMYCINDGGSGNATAHVAQCK